jgi:hypothetical protein
MTLLDQLILLATGPLVVIVSALILAGLAELQHRSFCKFAHESVSPIDVRVILEAY